MMKIGKIALLIAFISVLGCQGRVDRSIEEVEREIRHLEVAEARKAYLEKIFEDDQRVRGDEEQELMLKYGKDSKEHMGYVKAQWKMDEINLLKIEKYLEIHGYPGKGYGEIATTAPWMVIHHAQGYDARERNFEKVYEAYLKGDIDDGAMSLYLGRMYEMKNGKRLIMENPYKAEDEINQLISELNLEDKKANAQRRVAGQPR